ncbi:hypothetical protein Tco_0257190 [Tanacetum coccineum]
MNDSPKFLNGELRIFLDGDSMVVDFHENQITAVNTMAEQNVPAQPPTRKKMRQIVNSLQCNTNFFQAFTASANVPAIYLQQFWKTMSYNEKTGVYSCQLDEQWFDLSADLLRKALAITPVNPTHPFELPPLETQDPDFFLTQSKPQSQSEEPKEESKLISSSLMDGNLKFGPLKVESVEVCGNGIPIPDEQKPSDNPLNYPIVSENGLLMNTKKNPSRKCKRCNLSNKGAIPKIAHNTTPVKQTKPDHFPLSQRRNLPSVKLPLKLERERPAFPNLKREEGEGDNADLERAIKLSMDPAFLPQSRAPVGGVTIRDPGVDQTPPDSTTGPSSQPDDDTSEKVIHESSSTSDSERTESETEAAAPKGNKDQGEVDSSTVTSDALFSHMNKKKSANKNTTNYRLYHALMEALIADEDAMDKEVADKVKDHKRKHDSDDDEDDDDDEGPSAGSNQGRHSSGQSSDGHSKQDGGKSTQIWRTLKTLHIPQGVSSTTWFKPIPESERRATPEPEWAIPPNDFSEPEHNWENAYATTFKVPEENKLQRKTYDIGSFIKWFCRRTGKKKLCKADLEGPAFNLVKAFHKNSVFLQYQMDECHKLLSNKVDLSNPEGHQILRSIYLNHAIREDTKSAARYLDFGLEEFSFPSLYGLRCEREYDIKSGLCTSLTGGLGGRIILYQQHSESSDREAVRSQMLNYSVSVLLNIKKSSTICQDRQISITLQSNVDMKPGHGELKWSEDGKRRRQRLIHCNREKDYRSEGILSKSRKALLGGRKMNKEIIGLQMSTDK